MIRSALYKASRDQKHLNNFPFQLLKITSSPYLNRFVQPDTIIPDPSNPQGWNRFSYVHNTPTGYSDPTGHVRVADEDLSKNKASMDCRKHSRYCNGNKPKSTDDLLDMRPKVEVKQQIPILNVAFADMFTGGTDLWLVESWEGQAEIPQSEWDRLTSKVREDVHSKPWWLLVLTASNYDTPFFDQGGDLSGIGCFNGKCYTRAELNYMAQGELWAAVGVDKATGHLIVELWKDKTCLRPNFSAYEVCGDPSAYWQPSNGTLEMFDTGFDDYNQQYPSTP